MCKLISVALVPLFLPPTPTRGDSRAAATDASATQCVHWPQFRGPFARGVAECSVPTTWDATNGTNIRWKTAIPGLGHSSPIVWGDRVFLTTCVGERPNPVLRVGLYGDIEPVEDSTAQGWRVLCLSKSDGKILWERVAHEGKPKVKRHPKSTHANSTPATDGKHVIAFFGSEGLYAYSVAGDLLWKKDFGLLDSGYFVVPDAQWGFGSSPIIYQDLVIVQCDTQRDSFIAAFDVKDGTERWRSARNEVPTWSTPTVHEGQGRTQVIVNGYRHIGAYDVRTGEPLWHMAGGGDIPVPTPIVAHDLIFITNAHGGLAPIYAIRPTASGQLSLPAGASSNEHIAWSYERRGIYMQTPIVVGDHFFACRDNGVLTAYEAKSGRVLEQLRLGGGSTGFTASPIAAEGNLYYSSEEGNVYVVQAGPSPRTIATNPMGEVCMATPAIADGKLFVRTQHHLFCIGN